MSGGLKYDSEKLPVDLVPAELIYAAARALGYGLKKYTVGNVSGKDNWKKGLPWSKVIASILRHTLAIKEGDLCDPESGILHSDELAAEVGFLCYFIKHRPDLDDRFRAETPKEPEAPLFPPSVTEPLKSWSDSLDLDPSFEKLRDATKESDADRDFRLRMSAQRDGKKDYQQQNYKPTGLADESQRNKCHCPNPNCPGSGAV